MTAQVQREQDEGYLPPIAATVPDWDAYDAVYLGHPIWWGQLPHVMRAFLSQHDLAGKVIVPFSTSSSSGNAEASTPSANSALRRPARSSPPHARQSPRRPR